MKKTLCTVLAIATLVSALALFGCGNGTENTEPESENVITVTSDTIDELFPMEEGTGGEASNGAAYYKDGNLFVPINLAIKYNTYTVKSDKYTWYVRYSIGIAINHSFDMKEVSVECKNNIATIPEEYANENHFIKTRCNNVATFILITQKPNSGYIPEPEPDYPIIIR